MARAVRTLALAFGAITVEGALIAPAMLARIAQHQAESQSETDYGIPKGLTLRDEIARYFRIGQAMFLAVTASETPSAAATVSFIEKLLRDVFGFTDIHRVGIRTLGERQFAVTLEALGGRVPVVVVPPADDLDRPSAHLTSDGRRRSAASALQDWLNASEGALWGLCANGFHVRLVRDNASLTRPAHIEADLRRIFEGDDFADFAAFWLLIHASRFGLTDAASTDCVFERWRDAGQKEGVAARDKLRDGVEAALLSLGTGFLSHSENSALREKLRTGELPLPDFFGELLRLVYRLIFLLAAEDRNLLHPPETPAAPRKLYAEGYSVGSLRDRAVRRTAWDRHHDRWEGLLIAFAALERSEERLGLPALGGLFTSAAVPHLDVARLANRSLMEAIFRLAWLREPSGLAPVNWRDMETQELGSVYESLLELTPRLTEDGRGFAFAEGGETRGHARKTTGSYYTPDSLVEGLLDSALDPVLDRVEAETDDPAAALLSITVLDPACGSGHFLLAAARRIATRLARARTGGVASPADFRHALRDVARSCIHGVDRNPMAVELTRVALWIETVEPGKPLGFLDANIRCGDSLIGVFDLQALEKGIPDDAYKPLAGDDKETARHFLTRNRAERTGQGSLDFGSGGGRLPAAAPIVGDAKALRAMPEDSPEEILAKRARFEAARADPLRWSLRISADLYIAAFLTPKTGGMPANRNTVTIPTTAHVFDALAGRTIYGPLVGRAQDIAGAARAFHWPLEFTDVMAGGGFDVVLGNPPWERIKLQEQEFFASRAADISDAPTAATRRRLIAKLAAAAPGSRERELHEDFEAAKRLTESLSVFVRTSKDQFGRYPLTGQGDINTYALFAELTLALSSPRGRAGIIVPTGIATDATTAAFFASLIDQKRLVSLVSFENEEFIFPSVHHSFQFSLLTIGTAGSVTASRFVFLLRRIAQIANPDRHFTLSAEEIAAINPNTKTAPIFRSRADATLTAKIYSRIPVLAEEGKTDAWGIRFMRMFDMANDSGLFRTASQLRASGFTREGYDWILGGGLEPRRGTLELAGGPHDTSLSSSGDPAADGSDRYVPLYEAKMFDQFNHRYADYSKRGEDRGHRVLPELTEESLADPKREAEPFYWVPIREVALRAPPQAYFIGYGEATTATTMRTCVATAIPYAGVGHKEILVFTDRGARLAACFLANCNSFVLDFVTRTKVSYLTLAQFIFRQLPILPPSAYGEADLAFIVPRVLELTYSSYSMRPFARELGYDGPPYRWDDFRRRTLRAELDAWYACAYGLTRDELRYVLDPADLKGPDYPSETFRVLKTDELRQFGEYLTGKLVLQAWDRLLKKGHTTKG